MPRAVGIGFYDARGQCSGPRMGYDGPDPAPLVAIALARVPPATTGRIDGFSQEHEGAPAYVFRLRGNEGEVIAVALLLTRDGDDRPFSFVHSLVLPALECLQRELESRASVEGLTRDLQSRDEDLELLLKMAPTDPASPMAGDELGVAGADLRGPPRLPPRRAGRSGARHRDLQGAARRAAAGRAADQDPPAPAQLGAAAAPQPGDQQDQGAPDRAAALQDPVHARAPRVGPRERLPRAVPRRGRAELRAAHRAAGRAAVAQDDHHAAEQFRPADLAAHAPGLRDAGARPARGAATAGARVRAVPRRRPRARGQRQLRHARRRRGDRQDRRGAAQEAAPGRARSAHRRRPLRGLPARLHAGICAPDRGDAAPPVRGPHLRARRRHGAGVGQLSARPSCRRNPRTASRTASPTPRSPARRRRTAAATASSSSRTPTRASSGAAPTSWWSRRCTRRWPRTASRCSRSRSCRSTPSARSRASSSCCAWSARTASCCRRRSSCPRPSATSCCPRSTAG